jgi:hypothetical protein
MPVLSCKSFSLAYYLDGVMFSVTPVTTFSARAHRMAGAGQPSIEISANLDPIWFYGQVSTHPIQTCLAA